MLGRCSNRHNYPGCIKKCDKATVGAKGKTPDYRAGAITEVRRCPKSPQEKKGRGASTACAGCTGSVGQHAELEQQPELELEQQPEQPEYGQPVIYEDIIEII